MKSLLWAMVFALASTTSAFAQAAKDDPVAEKILRRELSNKTEQESYIRQLSNEVKLN